MPFFASRHVKHARLLLRHAEKVRRYKIDVLSESALAELDGATAKLKSALAGKKDADIRKETERLDAVVGKQAPPRWEAGWRENTEVIVVALIVAVAVRTYFIQPFKIPTGSMQPTLNGIIGHPRKEAAPNFLQQVVEFFVLGRNYIDLVAQQDVRVHQIVPQKYLFFFTWSRIICDRASYLIYCPPDTLHSDFNVSVGNLYRKGDVIARGAVDTGDQVFVDKFTYNFIKPRRGDVFVFRTNNIVMLASQIDPESGAPYYIKRLAGEPGDSLRIDPPKLFINGQLPDRYGFRRVIAAQAPYRGYSSGPPMLSDRQAPVHLTSPDETYTVPGHTYYAMGDNSYFSYDSRYWGPVPEQDLVGRGLAVYWPFNWHWGFIR